MSYEKKHSCHLNLDAKRLRIGQSAFRTVVNGEMSLRRLKLSIYEVVTPRKEEEEEDIYILNIIHVRNNTDVICEHSEDGHVDRNM